MTEDAFIALLNPPLKELGAIPEEGEEFANPPLDVLQYYGRGVRIQPLLPWLGWGVSAVAVVRQPVDIGFSLEGYRRLLLRLAPVVNHRFPPWNWKRRAPRGLALGLTTIVLTPEPIGPGDEGVLTQLINGRPLPRQRAVPLGLLRVNLGQEALAFALASTPDGTFLEPTSLADTLTTHLRRFVPLMVD